MGRKVSVKKPKANNSSSLIGGLKTEWNLFWETILGDDAVSENSEVKTKDPFVTGKLEVLTHEQIKAITKALSSDRKKLNQQLEKVSKEIQESSAKLESLKLVGGEADETELRINELNDLGQNLSEQLGKINERLKLARHREDAIKKASR
jgi:hypothetical protein